MARPIRVELEGAVYHVTARGNERRAMVRGDRDRRLWCATAAEMVERFGVRVQAYCLLSNHAHLVVGTPRGNLSQALGWLQLTYAVRFNHRHDRSGHLFQGRFKAVLVEADDYARWLVEYVHLNPVRPRDKTQPIPVERAAQLADYPWSSHRDYAGLRQPPTPWLCLDWLRYWGRTTSEAQAAYRRAVGRWFGRPAENRWLELRHGLVLGGEELLGRARGLIAGKEGLEEARWTQRQGAREREAAVRVLVADEADVRVRIWARVRLGGERGVAVARELGYADGSGVTQVVKRLEQAATKDRALTAKLERLKAALSRVKS